MKQDQTPRSDSLPDDVTRVTPPINPTRQLGIDPKLAERLEMLRSISVRALEPHEYEDRRDYVVVRHYPVGETLMLNEPNYLNEVYTAYERLLGAADPQAMESWREAMRESRRCAHPSKPVRLEGWYRAPFTIGDGGPEYEYLRFSVCPISLVQRYWMRARRNSWSNGRSFFDTMSNIHNLSENRGPNLAVQGVERITLTGVPTDVLRRWRSDMLAVQNSYRTRRADESLALMSDAINRNAHSVPFGTPITLPYATWRGIKYETYQSLDFKHDRELLKILGGMTRMARRDPYSSDVPTAEEFLDELMALTPPMRSQVGPHVARSWNRSPYTEDVIQASCGHFTTSDEVREVHSGDVCSECYDEGDYVMAEDTGEEHRRRDLYLHECGDYYTYEEDDEDDEDDLWDGDSFDFHGVPGIRSWNANVLNYFPADHSITPTPYGDFLMGIELELVPESDRRDSVAHTLRTLCVDYAIMKTDSSLDDKGGGFEVVTAPRGLAEHIRRFKEWEPHHALRAWDPECCGTHVHISSAAFSSSTLGKFVEFINCEANDDMIRNIAGRHPSSSRQSRQFCQREHEMIEGNPKGTLRGKSSNRYTMVNSRNVTRDEGRRLGLPRHDYNDNGINTIELRIFRASLNKHRMLAQIEFAHAAVMFCRWSSMRELSEPYFMTWLRMSAGIYPNLAKWFGVKANTQTIQVDPKVLASPEV